MKARLSILLTLVLVAAVAFLAGSWLTFQTTRPTAAPERKILHYVDPMNPVLKFDSPGIAPCGMPLEPVYADQLDSGPGGEGLRASLPPGTIRISPEKQQIIGVKTMTVEKAPWTHTLRTLGRVVPDETLVYRINAATEGWIEATQPVTTGSQVKKDELLATLSFFSLEYRTLVQNYFNLVNLGNVADQDLSPLVNNPQYSEAQLRLMRKAARFAGPIADSAQIDYYRKSLYDYGITPYQLKEMERTRLFPEVIEIRAPAAGFVFYRNVSPGQRVARGEDLFRVTDLSRVWVEADIFENEAAAFKPGMPVRVELPYHKRAFGGRVSPVLPRFSPATRTLQMRLTVENPDFTLRPDMFVNLEIPMAGPAAIVVPVDALLDSGLKQTVFVAREGGYFEPRSVETGRHLGERVEIVGGLMAGEEIVVSGNFLIDSEARIQQTATGIVGNIGRDPVCGMNIDEDRARIEGHFLEYKGKAYYFCETQCMEDFRKDPERYLTARPAGAMPTAASPATPSGHEGMAMPAASAPADAPAPPAPAVAHPGMTMPTGEPAKMTPRHEGMEMPMRKTPATTPGNEAMAPTETPDVPTMSGPPSMPSMPGEMALPTGGPTETAPGPGGMEMPTTAPPQMPSMQKGMMESGATGMETMPGPPEGGAPSMSMPEMAVPAAPASPSQGANPPAQDGGFKARDLIRRPTTGARVPPGAITPPATGPIAPRIDLRRRRYVSPESAPLRRQQLGKPAPPQPVQPALPDGPKEGAAQGPPDTGFPPGTGPDATPPTGPETPR